MKTINFKVWNAKFNNGNIEEIKYLLQGILNTIKRYRLFDKYELHIFSNTLNLKRINIQEKNNNIIKFKRLKHYS